MNIHEHQAKQILKEFGAVVPEGVFAFTVKDLIEKCNLTHLHVFPYSPRENTPAARMPQLDKSIIKNRANKLRQKGIEKLKQKIAKRIGKKDLILIEKNQNKKSIGKDQNFFNAIINEEIKEGVIIPCVYIGIDNDILMAKRI